jgi:hypothetical protein
MTFEEVVDQALAMLQRRGRITYRMLQRHFQLDDAAIADLKMVLHWLRVFGKTATCCAHALLVPVVPCTIAGCVCPLGTRCLHREALTSCMQASHPPMPCDQPCLVALHGLYSAQEERQPR